jgi:hypothetical protein
VVKEFGFIKNVEETCVYKKVSENTVVFLVIYVDDILLIGDNIPMMEAVKYSLRKSSSMKDLGEAAYILDIKIYRDISKRLIGLSQDAYIDKILNRFNMQDSKKCFLPMSHSITLRKKQCPKDPDEQKKNESDFLCFDYWIHHVCYHMHTLRCLLCSKCHEQVSIKLW